MSLLRAEFDLVNGIPVFREGPKYKHYRIKLSVVDPPVDALTMIYQLDNSYNNPIRMVTRGTPDFQEYITSYGDYVVSVLYRPISETSRLEKLVSQKLSEALRRTYASNATEAVLASIGDIQAH